MLRKKKKSVYGVGCRKEGRPGEPRKTTIIQDRKDQSSGAVPMEMRRAVAKKDGDGADDELQDLLPPSEASAAAKASFASSTSFSASSVNLLVLACFAATFAFYFERTGFPIIFTSAAKKIGKGLDEATKGQVGFSLL